MDRRPRLSAPGRRLVLVDIAEAVREAREHARFSQSQLAERAGTAQSTVAAYETGARIPSWRALDRLLEACGLAARLRLHPRYFEVDRALEVMLAKAPVDRLWEWSNALEHIARLNSPVVVMGGAALAAHGIPLPVKTLDLAVGTEPDEVRGAVELLLALRARYFPTDYEDPVPSRPAVETVTHGPRRLTTMEGTVVVWPSTLQAVRDRAVGVAVDGGAVWVAALSDIDPPAEDADLVRAYLDRMAVRSAPVPAPANSTEPGSPLRRHIGRSGEGVWSR